MADRSAEVCSRGSIWLRRKSLLRASRGSLVGIKARALLGGCPPIAATLLSGRITKATTTAMQKTMLNPRESSLVEKRRVKKIFHVRFQFLLVKTTCHRTNLLMRSLCNLVFVKHENLQQLMWISSYIKLI